MSDAASRDRPPTVSVVTAAYNAERFIEATLASALNQTFLDFEIFVIDDGSHDGTANVVRRIIASDSRVRLIEQDNRGIAAARNRGVREARGGMIAFLDHDDLWHADKLALQVTLLDAQPRCRGVPSFWRHGRGVVTGTESPHVGVACRDPPRSTAPAGRHRRRHALTQDKAQANAP